MAHAVRTLRALRPGDMVDSFARATIAFAVVKIDRLRQRVEHRSIRCLSACSVCHILGLSYGRLNAEVAERQTR